MKICRWRTLLGYGVICAILSSPPAFADQTPLSSTGMAPPSFAPVAPFAAVPQTQDAPKNPNDMPAFIVDERTQIHADFNALQKEDQGVEKDCAAAVTPVAHTQCDRNRQLWQGKMAALHARERELHRQIDFIWRKQHGLPPPPWYTNNNGQSGQQQNGAQPQKPSPDHSVLLPQSTTPMPANIY